MVMVRNSQIFLFPHTAMADDKAKHYYSPTPLARFGATGRLSCNLGDFIEITWAGGRQNHAGNRPRPEPDVGRRLRTAARGEPLLEEGGQVLAGGLPGSGDQIVPGGGGELVARVEGAQEPEEGVV